MESIDNESENTVSQWNEKLVHNKQNTEWVKGGLVEWGKICKPFAWWVVNNQNRNRIPAAQ